MTHLLHAVRGDEEEAEGQLIPLAYAELRLVALDTRSAKVVGLRFLQA